MILLAGCTATLLDDSGIENGNENEEEFLAQPDHFGYDPAGMTGKPVPFEGPCLVITFDDGNDTDYTVAFPLMAERGMRGVSYINTATIGEPGKLTWEQIRELRDAGWDLGCHTHSHPRITAIGEAELHQQMQAVDAAFREAGLEPPLHHAYPYTEYDPFAAAIVGHYRTTARGGEYPPLTIYDMEGDLLSLPGFRAYVQDQASLQKVQERIDLALQNGEILILYTHRITDIPAPYDAVPEYFEALLDYIAAVKIPVITLDELIPVEP